MSKVGDWHMLHRNRNYNYERIKRLKDSFGPEKEEENQELYDLFSDILDRLDELSEKKQ